MKTEHFDFEKEKGVYIIAEIGLNHNGNEDLALRMIEEASRSDANCVKFQLYKTENFIDRNASLPLAIEGSLFDFFKKYELSPDSWLKLKKAATKNRMDFLCSVFDEESLAFYHERLNSRFIKIASMDINNYLLLEKVKEYGYHVILSTGASEEQEIEAVRSRFGTPFAILECVANYPAKPEDYVLSLLPYWQNKYGCLVGVSDHTLKHEVSAISYFFGARILELHFTIDKDLEGPDQKISVTPKELRNLRKKLDLYAKFFTEPVKTPKSSEENVRMSGRRSLFYNKDMAKGTILRKSDIIALRPGGGIPPSEYENVINRILRKDVKKGERVYYDDFER